jgi:hypothetical protein
VSNIRRHSLALVGSLLAKLERADGGPLTLDMAERQYLVAVLQAAQRGEADPMRTGRAVGRPEASEAGAVEAWHVHRRRHELGTLRAACEAVGRETGRDGSKSGAVEKNYKARRAALEASDRFYLALAQGRAPEAADVAEVMKDPGKKSG